MNTEELDQAHSATLEDDRLSRGVQVRIISDNDKQHDEGSDIERLARAGIALKLDALRADVDGTRTLIVRLG
jgi:hypothetical protein